MNCSCPICFDLFDGHDMIATPCGHVFHSKCILKWIDDSSKVCPECRNKLTRNNIIKLYFNATHNETLQSDAGLQNELDAKKAELKQKDTEMAKAKSKIAELQDFGAKIEELQQTTHQKFLAADAELAAAKLQLKHLQKLEMKVQHLKNEISRLESQVHQFNDIQTVLEGNVQSAEEVLRKQGADSSKVVSRTVATNLANMCSLLKRELVKSKCDKGDIKKKVDDLTHQLGIKNAKIKRLVQSEACLMQKLQKASPLPVKSSSVSSTPNNLNLSFTGQATPIMTGGRAKTPSEASAASEVTPISINFSDKKKHIVKKVRIDSGAAPTIESAKPSIQLPFLKPMLPVLKRKLDRDEDSITRVGYNGLGGHERVVTGMSAREKIAGMDFLPYMALTKPYKKNPNVKKAK